MTGLDWNQAKMEQGMYYGEDTLFKVLYAVPVMCTIELFHCITFFFNYLFSYYTHDAGGLASTSTYRIY